jgi:hypothetical protein
MKRYLALILFFTLNSCGFQRKGTLVEFDPKEKEVTDAMFHGLNPRDSNDRVRRDRMILDLTYSDWLGDRKQVKTGWQSIGWQMALYRDFPLNKQSTVSLASGLRFGRSVIQHNGLFLITEGQSHSVLHSTELLDFQRRSQKFLQSELMVPVEFRFRGFAKSSWRLTLGGAFGIRVNSYEKWKIKDSRFREFNHHNLSLFRGSVYLRFGYNKIGFFSAYHFIPVFTGPQDSKLNTVQFGLSFTVF